MQKDQTIKKFAQDFIFHLRDIAYYVTTNVFILANFLKVYLFAFELQSGVRMWPRHFSFLSLLFYLLMISVQYIKINHTTLLIQSQNQNLKDFLVWSLVHDNLSMNKKKNKQTFIKEEFKCS